MYTLEKVISSPLCMHTNTSRNIHSYTHISLYMVCKVHPPGEEIHGTRSPSGKYAIDKSKPWCRHERLVHMWTGYYQAIAPNKDKSRRCVIYIDVKRKENK